MELLPKGISSWFICPKTTKKWRGKSQLYQLEIILKRKETMQGAGGFLCADQEILAIMGMALIGTEELPQIMRASGWVFSSCGDPDRKLETHLWARGTEVLVFLFNGTGAGSTCSLTLSLRFSHTFRLILDLLHFLSSHVD